MVKVKVVLNLLGSQISLRFTCSLLISSAEVVVLSITTISKQFKLKLLVLTVKHTPANLLTTPISLSLTCKIARDEYNILYFCTIPCLKGPLMFFFVLEISSTDNLKHEDDTHLGEMQTTMGEE